MVKKGEEAVTDSRERTADTLFTDLESLALAIEGSDLDITEDNVVPTAKCVQDTKERQLVTRSGLQRQRCSVYHLHHKQAMKAPYRVRQLFGTVLQQVHHFKADVIAGDANAAAYTFYKKQEYQYLYNSSVAVMLREMQREVNTDCPFESGLQSNYYTKNHFLSFAQQVIMIVASWLLSHGENHLDPKIMRKLWSNTRERTQGNKKEHGEDSSYPQRY